MLTYPPVSHRIPELFSLIIANDNYLSLIPREKIVSLKRYREARSNKTKFILAAENYVKRQKGGKD